MKSNFLKLAAPGALFLLAVAGAFGTDVAAKEKASKAFAFPGYIHTVQNPCEVTAWECSNIGSAMCTTPAGVQLYKLEANGSCPLPLKRN